MLDVDSQIDAARWRSLTYSVIEAASTSRADSVERRAELWGDSFMRLITGRVVQPLIEAFQNAVPHGVPNLDASTTLLQKLGRDAYMWSFRSKTNHLHRDFHPIMFGRSKAFGLDEMQGLGVINPLGSPIVASVGLGLKSSVAPGHHHDPKEGWQEKVPVITEGYFQD
jgi:hypothetical protein